MIDISVIREAYEKQDMSDICLFRSEQSLSDAFSHWKRCTCCHLLLEMVIFHVDVIQSVNRAIKGRDRAPQHIIYKKTVPTAVLFTAQTPRSGPTCQLTAPPKGSPHFIKNLLKPTVCGTAFDQTEMDGCSLRAH